MANCSNKDDLEKALRLTKKTSLEALVNADLGALAEDIKKWIKVKATSVKLLVQSVKAKVAEKVSKGACTSLPFLMTYPATFTISMAALQER